MNDELKEGTGMGREVHCCRVTDAGRQAERRRMAGRWRGGEQWLPKCGAERVQDAGSIKGRRGTAARQEWAT